MDLTLSQKYFISLLKIIIAKFTHHQSNLKLLKLKESFQLKSRPTLPNWIYYCCACIAFQKLRRIQMGKLRLAEEKEKKTQLAACKWSTSYKTIEITNPHQKMKNKSIMRLGMKREGKREIEEAYSVTVVFLFNL